MKTPHSPGLRHQQLNVLPLAAPGAPTTVGCHPKGAPAARLRLGDALKPQYVQVGSGSGKGKEKGQEKTAVKSIFLGQSSVLHNREDSTDIFIAWWRRAQTWRVA